jgi:DNA repair protein RecN (Recombination protein N)
VLTALTIRDIVLIEQAALEFAPGLNVLTGETGAGKSILLDSLGLAVGGRGRASVRAGAASGAATAVFEPPAQHPARALLKDQDMAADGEIVLRRSLAADGKSRAFVNDEAVGVGLLKDLGGLLLEVHGQQDDRGLFDVATHRVLLDEFGGHDLAPVVEAHAALSAAKARLEDLKALAARAQADAEFVRAAARELSDFAPEAGEEEKLAAERALMMNASKLAEEIAAASDALSGDKGAESQLAVALKKLSRLGAEAQPLTKAAETALEQAYALAEEARRELDSLLTRLDTDTGALERAEERLFALRALARKYGVAADALPALAGEYRAKEEALVSGGDQIKKADAAVAAARQTYVKAAEALSKARAVSAQKLEAAVAAELAPLKLGHAKFRVTLTPLEDGTATGAERVAFEIATVEGAPFGSLSKIASGGELARFSLALKVALAGSAAPAAMVFDEVDRGVGGAVADAVGLRLQRLAENTQVLLVTHSPQVAARAARHFRISRAKDKTRIEMLDDDERLEEIARMLSGATVTDEARAAARRLMAEAAAQPKKQRKRA